MHSRARIKLQLLEIAIIVLLVNGAGSANGNSTVVDRVSEDNISALNEEQVTESSTIIPTVLELTTTTTTTKSVVSEEITSEEVTQVITTTESVTLPTVKPQGVADLGNDGHEKQQNCSQFPLSPQQPVYYKDSRIKKCCPPKEIFEQDAQGRLRCVSGNRTLEIEIIYAMFYGDDECIQDKQNKLHFSFESKDQCLGNNETFQYGEDLGDKLFVIQNGSLLVITEDRFMTVFDRYCVEMDTRSQLVAKACDATEPIMLKSTAILIYIGMVLASLTLLFTCLAYALVPKLNDAFGYLLSAHSASFLIGLILTALSVCGDRCTSDASPAILQLFGQIFLMTSIYTFLLINIYNYVYAAYYLPNGLEFDTKSKRDVFIFLGVLYTITVLPLFLPWKNALIFHLMLYIYYMAKGVVLYLSQRALRTLMDSKFIRFTVSQQNYRELTYTEAVNAQPRINGERLEDIRTIHRLLFVETIFTFVCWVLYSSLCRQISSQHDFYRIAAAYALVFQGLLIGVLFVGGRKKWTIIRECWNYSGSIDLREVEMEREMRTLERKTPLL